MKGLMKRLSCKHCYNVFVSSRLVNSGMDKEITRKCGKCGKERTANIDGWGKNR